MNNQNYSFSLPIISSNLITQGENNIYREQCGKIWEKHYQKPTNLNSPGNNGVFLTPYATKTFKSDNGQDLTVGIIGTMSPASAMVSITGRQPCFHYTGFNESKKEVNAEEYSNQIYEMAMDLKLGRNGAPKCQVIVVLSHEGEPEDKQIAEMIVKKHKSTYKEGMPKVAVDIHISSHSHNIYLEKLQIDSEHEVYIHQSGPYASNLGVLQLSYNFDTQQVRLLNEKVKVPLSNLVGDASNRDLFEKDHLGPLSPSTSLFETNGICFDCISNSILFPVRIPITNEIPMDQPYRKKIENYKHLINKYILGDSFGYRFDSFVGSIDVSNVHDKTGVGSIVSNCVIQQFREKQAEALVLLEFLKKQEQYNEEQSIEENIHKLDKSLNVPKFHRFFSKLRIKDAENILDQRYDIYLIPTDGLRTHIISLKQWNETRLNFQFSDAYTFLSLGRLRSSIREDVLPGETMEVYYLPQRIAKRLFVYTRFLSDLLNLHIIAFCHSTNFSYKTRWYGIPFLVEDQLHKKEEKELSWFWKIIRKVKNALARHYDFSLDGKSEAQFFDEYYSKPHTFPEPLYGITIPGWLVNFMSKTAMYTGGFLTLDMRDKYGRIIKVPQTNEGKRSDGQYNAKDETRSLLQTSVSATPFMDYHMFAECLAKQRNN
ncbi:predicted protein [Naegleria gruberi]|uniref:Predicted protein n=1 Tax=Naegleria gruberi TaxID=5762 RepID=D2VVP4_NAEGR|nr:uncharacterized protein NAEGRDRAFT_52634 [Naegleria gruberi]EFC39077.1 predicted protein [Naegleria gruberi]|eukprot:XP_002671821.1 predicted protein [Naegleria gruberi strain NEG-M]